MTLVNSLWLFQTVHAVGLAIWLSIAVVNNWQAFLGSMGAVGATMSMAPFKQAPAIETPLLTRAVHSEAWHRMALLVVLVLQVVAAIACWIGSYELILADGLIAARPWLNIALSSFAAFIFAMHLGGLWFAYWIKQEGLQLTHLAMLAWTLMAFFLFNASWA